jgi:hypothetical protein
LNFFDALDDAMEEPAMPIYNIYMVDLVPNRARRFLRFEADNKRAVAAQVQTFFERVCNGTQIEPRANFLPGTPHENELVVYFIPDRSESIIVRERGPAPTDNEGQTWFSVQGMISEVYVAQAGPQTDLLAKCAFHELMHNKLDIHPAIHPLPSGTLHSQGGGGLAELPLTPSSVLTQQNIQLMKNALNSHIRQYWNPGLIFSARR